MPSWTDYVGFGLGLLAVPHLIAFVWPHGRVSRRLHPTFPADIAERNLHLRQITTLEKLIELEKARQRQPDPLGDLELVTTVRRSPRRTRANSSIDGLRGPALSMVPGHDDGLFCLEKTLEGSASRVELPPVRGAGYEPSASSGEPTGVAFIQAHSCHGHGHGHQLTSKAYDTSSPKRQRACLRSRSLSNTKAISNTDNTFLNLVASPSMFLLSHSTNTPADHTYRCRRPGKVTGRDTQVKRTVPVW